VLQDRRGVTASEYAILAVGVTVAVGAAVVTLTDPNTSAFVVLGNTLASTLTSLQSIGGAGR
jgi:Flp pilus assembly pilin Flp